MAREGKIRYKRSSRNNVQLNKKGSDESDEDYKVSEDEGSHEIEDEYCSSLAEDESEESFGEFDEEEEEEEEEWLEKKVKNVGRPSGQKGFQGRKKNGAMKTRKIKLSYSEEEEEDYDGDGIVNAKQRKRNKISYKEEDDDDDFGNEILRFTRAKVHRDSFDEKPRKKTKVSYREEKEDGDYDDSEDDDDVEFTPDEANDLDDEEELPVAKKIKVHRLKMQETQIAEGHRKKSKRTQRKKPVKEKKLRKKHRSESSNIDDLEFRDERHTFQKKKKATEQGRGRRRKLRINSDSDFVSSGPSDCEFTISEEEREQVREASAFCKRLTSSLRSSSSSKMVEEEELVPSLRKRPGRKGKEKVVDLKIEVGKQVCGICLSEEGKRTVRGILNCCSHYFCFACIMEWSKVETRCPLCKQRFKTITKTTRAVHDLRDPVIAVPERDQVYQPSEEELRGYLDPYESVLCTECMQGGDDAHMLLCDLCDSPAHTYCVGLGVEVPDGNWYCDGCRPTSLASANAQAQNPTTDLNATNNLSVSSSPIASVRETFDLNEEYVPETPLTPMTGGHSQSPRHSVENSQASAPASTLFARRRIHQRIHQFRNRSGWPDRTDSVAMASGTTLFGTQIGQNVVRTPHQAYMPTRTAPQDSFHQGRLPGYGTPSMYSTEVLSPGLSSLRGQALRDQGSTSMDQYFVGVSPHGEFSGINQQLHPCSSRSTAGVRDSILSYQFREATVPSRTLQGTLNPPF